MLLPPLCCAVLLQRMTLCTALNVLADVLLQYLACNRKKYIIRDSDDVLIKDSCTSGALAAAVARLPALLVCMAAAAAALLLALAP